MLPTVEAYYRDGKIDLKELPEGIKESKILITFLDKHEKKEIPVINWDELKENPSKVDKWIGILAGTSIPDAKKLRKEYIETKHK